MFGMAATSGRRSSSKTLVLRFIVYPYPENILLSWLEELLVNLIEEIALFQPQWCLLLFRARCVEYKASNVSECS